MIQNNVRRNGITVYKGHRFPEAVISQVVWLYYRFSPSFRDVEEPLVSRETHSIQMRSSSKMLANITTCGFGGKWGDYTLNAPTFNFSLIELPPV